MESNLTFYDTDELIFELESRGYSISGHKESPHNNIIDQDLMKRFIVGFGKIDKKELEDFLCKFGI
jgi:hypothetical protein